MNRAKKATTQCVNCGSAFQPRSNFSRRCDACCTHICRACGQVFVQRAWSKGKRPAFCSLGCVNSWQQRTEAKSAASTKTIAVNGHGEMRTCVGCGKTFYATGHLVKQGGGIYCSMACKRVAVELICPVCGARFSRPPSDLRSVNYCSNACRDAGVSERRCQGEWVGVPTSLEVAGRAILRRLGVEFSEQVAIGRFAVDALLADGQTVIQWDGDFWHGHPDRFPRPSTVQRRNAQRDRACDTFLAGSGYRVLRFWESDVHGRPSWVSSEIQRALANSEST